MILLQIAENVTTEVAQQATADAQLNLLQLIIKGGWVMIPILILSIMGFYIFFERYFTLRKANKDESGLMVQVRELIKQGNVSSAIALCKQSNTPIGRMLQKGLLRIGKPIKEIEGSIENVGKLEVAKLEKNISILGIIAGIAPMLGFVGTISGVIKIFYNISLSDNISIGIIAGGLYEKMITSAAGLIVGILAYIGHHVLNLMVDKIILKLETESIDFIDLLEEPSK
ncbi:MAG: MotA/TolQ/ExbB proton channel family protein [bacterium]|jgi:biopolymer transport protein ExbB